MKVYNTLTKKKEELETITPGEVKIYACGPTVYNFFHIGNARPLIVFDTLRRYLEYRGNKVVFVQNFTDIDDKMINKAKLENTTVKDLADRYIAEYYKDADALGIERPTVSPKATEHMDEIITLIQKLIDNKHAYVVENGDVYYQTRTFDEYGKLSGQRLEELEPGARIETGDIKRDNADFALWKAKKEGEPYWKSPWGEGRPGWHIECSAMSMKYLGETFDIHAGGMDLIFPHHENEIAQSEGATGKSFANYWMHNGYININNQKMSKSAGNFSTIRDISKEYNLETVRLFILGAHYRNPVNFSRELLDQSQNALERLKNARGIIENAVLQNIDKPQNPELAKSIETHKNAFIEAMDDDLNTADALGVLFDFIRESNTYFGQEQSAKDAAFALAFVDEICGVFGILRMRTEIPDEIIEMAKKRQAAREQKNWALSDQLRDEIIKQGYMIEDSPTGPIVKPLEQ